MERNDVRSLTDADVRAMVDEIEKRLEARFYRDFGKSVWGVMWKTVLALLISAALWIAAKGQLKG